MCREPIAGCQAEPKIIDDRDIIDNDVFLFEYFKICFTIRVSKVFESDFATKNFSRNGIN
jgi:hypothetical protein